MPPSESPESVRSRPVPTAEDFPRSGPFSLAAPAPRFGARAVDLSIVLAPALLIVLLTSRTVGTQVHLDVPVWLGPALLAFGALYETLGVALAQRTPGKALFGLRVVRFVDGGRPRFVQCLLRGLLPWSVFALPIGAFALGGTVAIYGTGIGGSLHRGLPDSAAGTLVLSTR